jgi:aspartate carbamoyltransferase catalytic subunit
LLGKYENITIYFVSIPALQIADDIKIYLKKHGVVFHETSDLHSVIGNVDVVYQTRIQKERFASEADYEKCRGNFHINLDVVAKMKPDAIIMHPLPRIDEIATEVDTAPQAVYFKQAKYGVLVRMALLMWVLKK